MGLGEKYNAVAEPVAIIAIALACLFNDCGYYNHVDEPEERQALIDYVSSKLYRAAYAQPREKEDLILSP